MPISVKGPDGVINQFPDNMADADIEAAMSQHYAPAQAAQPVAPQEAPVAKGSFMQDLTNPDPTTYYPKTLPIPMVKESSGARRFGAPALIQDIYKMFVMGGQGATGQLSPDQSAQASPEIAMMMAGAPIAKEAPALAKTAAKDAGELATTIADRAPRLLPKEAAAPTREAIKTASQNAYKTAEDAGVIVAPEPFKAFADETALALKKSGVNDRLHPNAAAAMDDIKAAADSGKPQTLQDIEILRRVANSAVKGAANDDQAAKAYTVVNSIDDFINNLDASKLVEGNADVAVPALNQARPLWAKNAKMGDIEDIVDVASREDEPAKYIQQQFRRISRNQKRFSRFTKDEQSVITDIAKTGALGQLGKLAPSVDLAGIIKTAPFAGAAIMGNPLALGVPIVAYGAKKLSESARMSNVDKLSDIIARGRPAQSLLGRVTTQPRLLR